MSLAIAVALFRWRHGLPLTDQQEMIVAYHPEGTQAGCASCGGASPAGRTDET